MDSEENYSKSQSENGSEEKEKKESKEKDNNQKKESKLFQNEKSVSLFKGSSYFGNTQINPNSRINYYTPKMPAPDNTKKKDNEIKNENSKVPSQNTKKDDNANISHNTSLFIEEMSKTLHRALTAQQQHNTCLTHVTILHSTSQLRKISN